MLQDNSPSPHEALSSLSSTPSPSTAYHTSSDPSPVHISSTPGDCEDNADWISVLEKAINDELASDRAGVVRTNSKSGGSHNNSIKPILPSLTVPIIPIVIPDPPVEDEAEEQESRTEGDWTSTHHGLSRRALAHRKKFWSFRAEEWQRIETKEKLGFDPEDGDDENEEAYDAFFEWSSSPPTSPTSPTSLFPSSPTHQNDSPTAGPGDYNCWSLPDVPIYPRMGDLLKLHDDRASMMDKAFNTFSLHTISKILYLHDMLDRAPPSSPTGEDTRIQTSTAETEADGSRSLSPDSSDDDTLVDEEMSESTSVVGCDKKDMVTSHTREWEIDWTARWQILVRKLGIDEMMKAIGSAEFNRELLEVPTRPPSRMFFFPEQKPDIDDDGDDDDDDDDYGEWPLYRLYNMTPREDVTFYVE